MKILIYKDGFEPPKDYLAKLLQYSIQYEIQNLPTKLEYKKNDATSASLQSLADTTYVFHDDSVDVIQVFSSRKTWGLAQGVTGKQYHKTYSGYQIAFVRENPELAESAIHEIAHTWDNICRIYTGVSLEKVMNVRSFDDDVVHRRDPKTKQYLNNYDDVYPIIRPYLDEAIRKRRIIHLQNLLTRLLVEIRKIQTAQKHPESIPEEPLEAPELPVVKSNREKLYDTAYACLGKDMSDRAPNDLGCADSLNNVFEKAFGKEIGGGASTAEMLKVLKKDPRFVEISAKEALPGDIAMNASGTSTKGNPTGHVGVWGKNNVMSNNSLTGKWDSHYTLVGWVDFFEKKKGFKTRYFRIK